MAHSPKPFFKAKRKTWYVEVGRVQHFLGNQPDHLPPPKKRGGHWQPPDSILAAFYRKMAELEEGRPEPTARPASDAVAVVVEHFLDWCHEHRAKDTYEWYRWRLQLFVDHAGRCLTVAQLRHYHLDDWLKKHTEWASGTKHGMARAVMRAMSWAKKKGYIDINPVADYEKSRPGKRKVVIAPATFDNMLTLAGNQAFRDLLVLTWETAARPQESLVAEARHVDLVNSRLVFPPEESKGEQWPRIVYLTEPALQIVKRLMLKNREGPLLRNSEGVPWTTDAVNCAFQRLQLRMGMEKLRSMRLMPEPVAKPPREERRSWGKGERERFRSERRAKLAERRQLVTRLAREHAPKYCLYHLRHSWLDRALKRGVDALTCAILMGHRDPSTISRVYQHLSQSPEYLKEQARRVC